MIIYLAVSGLSCIMRGLSLKQTGLVVASGGFSSCGASIELPYDVWDLSSLIRD